MYFYVIWVFWGMGLFILNIKFFIMTCIMHFFIITFTTTKNRWHTLFWNDQKYESFLYVNCRSLVRGKSLEQTFGTVLRNINTA